MLYAGPDTPAWTESRALAELKELATVCMMLGCDKLQAIVDNTIVKLSSRNTTYENVLGTYLHAIEHDLPGMQQESAKKLFELIGRVQLPTAGRGSAEELLVPLLSEEQRLHKAALASPR